MTIIRELFFGTNLNAVSVSNIQLEVLYMYETAL